MRVIVGLGNALGARALQPITAAHVDGCLYNGQVSLDFSERLRDLGARVSVPTTLNVGSFDLMHPELIRPTETTGAGRELMASYRALGCAPTWTCAPYQLASRPAFGDHIAWAESNAISFVNSVVGARTDRYGDFVDICAAITGRVPLAGLHLTQNRLASIVFDCAALPAVLLQDTSGWAVLGALIGGRAGGSVVAITGIADRPSEDQLKAFASTAASAGGIALFHIVGVTPEAPTLDAVRSGAASPESIPVTVAGWQSSRTALTSTHGTTLHAVSVGTPHFSLTEFGALAGLLEARGALPAGFPFYVSTSRAVLAAATELGYAETCRGVGVRILTDTCTYVSAVLDPAIRTVMTNSGKWAWYAPANLGIGVAFGSLQECVDSAYAGTVMRRSVAGIES